MTTYEFMFRALCLTWAVWVGLDTWFMWRRGEALRRDLDEARRRVEEARKETK